jgi:transposase-like protein
VPKPSQVPEHENSPAQGQRKQRDRGVGGASLESVAPKKRRRFVASERLRLLKAADAAVASGERGALQALLRTEGIYSSHLSTWRQQLAARGSEGLTSQKPGRKPKLDDKDRQLLALTKRNIELERKLLIANAVIGLQKKAHEILGIALPESDEKS